MLFQHFEMALCDSVSSSLSGGCKSKWAADEVFWCFQSLLLLVCGGCDHEEAYWNDSLIRRLIEVLFQH